MSRDYRYIIFCVAYLLLNISLVISAGRGDVGKAVNQWSRKKEAMRHPELRTSLPLTGHSLATRSALNSPDRAP